MMRNISTPTSNRPHGNAGLTSAIADGAARAWRFLLLPLVPTDEERLSQAIDGAHTAMSARARALTAELHESDAPVTGDRTEIRAGRQSGKPAEDRGLSPAGIAGELQPAVKALLDMAGPGQMPRDLAARSWAGLEGALFAPALRRKPLVIPASQGTSYRGALGLVGRIPRLAVAGLAVAAVIGTYAGWAGPGIRGRALAAETAQVWSSVADYRAAVQYICRIPGFQTQWSGIEYYEAPDRMRIDMDAMGYPSVLVVRENSGIARTPTGAPARMFRFMASTLLPGRVVEQMRLAPDIRQIGTGDVVGQPCQVVSFSVPGRDGSLGGAGQVSLARVWISRRDKLPVQVEEAFPDGTLALSYRCPRIVCNEPASPDLFSLRPMAGGRPAGKSERRASVGVEVRTLDLGRI
jgi:hypothetical protein